MRAGSRCRRYVARVADRLVLGRLPTHAPAPDGGPVLVIAPHPDDESLGCGGLVARLTGGESPAPVTVVIVTDGARANRRAMVQAQEAGVDLPAVRRTEALEACSRLGVEPGSVRFLDLPDGGVGAARERAVALVADLLEELQPAVVVHPHEADAHPDHAAVGWATFEAARRRGRPVSLYGYQVWLWHCWPWTGQAWRRPRQWLANGRRSVRCLGWIRSERTVQVRLAPAEAGRKRAAVDAHQSQVASPAWASDWAVLGDISGGDLLARLLRPVEIYQVRCIG